MADFVCDEGGDLLELRRRRVRRLDDQTSFATSYLKDVIVFVYCILLQLLQLLSEGRYCVCLLHFIAFIALITVVIVLIAPFIALIAIITFVIISFTVVI
jgi:hypothetical protein